MKMPNLASRNHCGHAIGCERIPIGFEGSLLCRGVDALDLLFDFRRCLATRLRRANCTDCCRGDKKPQALTEDDAIHATNLSPLRRLGECNQRYCGFVAGCCITSFMVSRKDLSERSSSMRRCLISVVVFVAAIAGAASIAAAAPDSHLARPNALRCAGQVGPLAVANAHPEFSWKLEAVQTALHGVAQIAYEIQVVASESQFGPMQAKPVRGILWDSGIVQSSAISGVRYAGPALEAGHEYAWRVQVWDERNRPIWMERGGSLGASSRVARAVDCCGADRRRGRG